jgi:hypothetical protein
MAYKKRYGLKYTKYVRFFGSSDVLTLKIIIKQINVSAKALLNDVKVNI